MLRKTATIYRWQAWLLLMTLLALSLQPVFAVKEGDRFEDWTIGCEKLGEQESTLERCFIYQTVVDSRDDQPVLQIAVGYLPGDQGTEKPAAILTVPLGVALRPGMAISVDEGEMINVQYERCVPKGCIAGLALNQAVIKQFEKGLKAQVLLHDGVRRIALPVSLKGFTKGFASLR